MIFPNAEIIDITHPLSADLAPWPGDTGLRLTRNLQISTGASVNLSDIRLSLHLGTHLDAPWHFDDRAATIDQVALPACLGPARILDASDGPSLTPELFQDVLPGERVLIRTGAWPDVSVFPDDFPTLSEAAATRLAELDVPLVGFDLPSVDLPDSKTLPIHHALGRAGIFILECLKLDHVTPGPGQLLCLPLKIVGGDASPVRAVFLRTSNGDTTPAPVS